MPGISSSVIIWESLIEGGSKAWCTIWGVWVSCWGSGGLGWSSSDHHGDGDVIVVRGILGFISVLSSDGVEGIIIFIRITIIVGIDVFVVMSIYQ